MRKGMRLVLLAGGIVFVFFGIGGFLPAGATAAIYNLFGRAVNSEYAMAGTPLALYVMRLGLFAVLLLGALFILAAAYPAKFPAMPGVAIGFAAFFLVFAPVAGWLAGIHCPWFLLDSGLSLIFLLLLSAFRRPR